MARHDYYCSKQLDLVHLIILSFSRLSAVPVMQVFAHFNDNARHLSARSQMHRSHLDFAIGQLSIDQCFIHIRKVIKSLAVANDVTFNIFSHC